VAAMFLTKKHIPRRMILQGLGAALGLPLLDAMVPAHTPLSRTPASVRPRFLAIEMVHGAAGSTGFGRAQNLWSPAGTGPEFEFTSTLGPLESLRDYITIVSDTELKNAGSLTAEEDGPMADHARSSAAFLTAQHPKRTADSDIAVGPSLDQILASHSSPGTPLASAQMCIEDVDTLSGVCGYGYSCAYSHTISWASATVPLPMERAPRTLFDRFFLSKAQPPGSVLDATAGERNRLRRRLGPADRRRVGEYLDEIRDLEQRIQQVEARYLNASARELVGAPSSVPDSFEEHVGLMFDLIRLAFQADLTRICTLKLGIDRSQRLFPESGVTTPFHALSHHREEPPKILEFERLNRYHVGLVAAFLQRLRDTSEGNGNLLQSSAVLYGSPMGDSHVHGHQFLPLFIAGQAGGRLRGNLHVRCTEGTPMANVLLTLARKFGVELDHIGDSTGEIAL
jgi:hypothetical protein